MNLLAAKPELAVLVRLLRSRCSGGAIGLMVISCLGLNALGDDAEGSAVFQKWIQPTLEARCYDCHAASAERVKGGLLLDRAEGLLVGGHSGPAIIPGDPDRSLLIQAIRHEDLEMPPKGDPLSAATIAQFERWISLGAPDPRDAPMIAIDSSIDLEAGRKHWAFQPLYRDRNVPKGEALPASIDGLVSRRLAEAGLELAPKASRRDLIRRLYFDVVGLPPTEEDYDRFLSDSAPDAYSRLVDRLLTSPKFGERQSQIWLDVVRFAESEGFEYDRHLPDAWRYRDYVVDSLNRDKNYKEFLREQLAGDEMSPPTEESLAAAVFHRLGAVRRNAGNPDIALSRNEVLTERADVIGAAVLGLTIGCARCHDHKFDPISQRDYYQFQAYLAATAEHNVELASPAQIAEWKDATADLDRRITSLQKELKRARAGDRNSLEKQLEALEAERPGPLPKIPSIRNDFENVTKMHVLKRGVWERKGDPVGMKPLDVFVGADAPERSLDEPRPRTKMAAWLTDQNPALTARVMVNRIWQHYFDIGIVETSNDFGRNGREPSHPVLLDFLASELIRHEWRLKPIHRLILLSQVYQQTARRSAPTQALKVDPNNRLLWQHSKRRLTGEEIRDSMLRVAGVLNERIGGASVMLPVEEDLIKLLYKPDQWQVTPEVSEHFRRSVYLIAKRNLRLPFMEAFDQPALLTSCYRRDSSTHAPQALELLNGNISNQLAAEFAARLERLTDGDPSRLAELGYRLTLGRAPNDAERGLASDFVKTASVKEFALALFNLNEFLYVF